MGSSAGFKSNFPVDDNENIPLKGPSAGSSRMLKMFLTDGKQQVFILECIMCKMLIDLPVYFGLEAMSIPYMRE